jgi:hypothetical protein
VALGVRRVGGAARTGAGDGAWTDGAVRAAGAMGVPRAALGVELGAVSAAPDARREAPVGFAAVPALTWWAVGARWVALARGWAGPAFDGRPLAWVAAGCVAAVEPPEPVELLPHAASRDAAASSALAASMGTRSFGV